MAPPYIESLCAYVPKQQAERERERDVGVGMMGRRELCAHWRDVYPRMVSNAV